MHECAEGIVPMSLVQLPQLRDGRDDETAKIKLINQLRRNVPGPTQTVQASGSINLLTTGIYEIVPANATGWVTLKAFIIPDTVTGAQSVGSNVSIGTAASLYTDIYLLNNLGVGLVAGQPVELTPFTTDPDLPIVETDALSVKVASSSSGPTTLTATFYLLGFYR